MKPTRLKKKTTYPKSKDKHFQMTPLENRGIARDIQKATRGALGRHTESLSISLNKYINRYGGHKMGNQVIKYTPP